MMMMVRATSLVVLHCALLLVAGVAAGRGGDRVIAEVRPCYETKDGKDVQVFRCLGGNEGGVRPQMDPFLVFDAYRAASPAALGGGFPAHAHRGFTELRYILSGALSHKDSCGGEATTLPGGAQLFFAGVGAAHEENVTSAAALTTADAAGGTADPKFLFEGFQVWVNAPSAKKSGDPRHRVVQSAEFPVVKKRDSKPHDAPPTYTPPPAAETKVLAGRFGGEQGPLSSDIPGLIFLDVFKLRHRAYEPWILAIPDESDHVLIYVYRGSVLVQSPNDPDGDQTLDEGEFAPLAPGLTVTLRAGADPDGKRADASCVVLTAGRVREPVFVGSGFAMQSRDALDAAFDDLKAGRAASCGKKKA